MGATDDVQVGPYGGPAGNYAFEFKPNGKIIKIYVRSGDCIDSIKFGYIPDGSSQVEQSPRYGGEGGSEKVVFVNSGDEKIIELSGTICSMGCTGMVLTSLTFKTTKNSYVFGSPRGEKFSLPVKAGKFAGFHGKYGSYLDSIGGILVSN